MKSKLTRRASTAAAITALMLGIASIASAADLQNTTNLPSAQAAAAATDPSTGLPVPTQAERWISPDWNDPGQVLPDVSFDLPLSEVAKNLRVSFKDAFDVILPNSCDWQNPDFQAPSPSRVDAGAVMIKLQLKNVTATEIFNAMNLAFGNESIPLRWELRANGNRPLALLRVVPALLPPPVAASSGAPVPPPVEKKLMAFFVGGLAKSGGRTTAQLFKTICEVYDLAYPAASQGDLKFHEEAQLIVVNASPDRIDFVRNTLAALEGKERMLARTAVDAKTKTEAPKKNEAAPDLNK